MASFGVLGASETALEIAWRLKMKGHGVFVYADEAPAADFELSGDILHYTDLARLLVEHRLLGFVDTTAGVLAARLPRKAPCVSHAEFLRRDFWLPQPQLLLFAVLGKEQSGHNLAKSLQERGERVITCDQDVNVRLFGALGHARDVRELFSRFAVDVAVDTTAGSLLPLVPRSALVTCL